MNLVLLMGNLGADPELLNPASGPILKLRLATTHSYYDKDKAKQSSTEWHRVTFFGTSAVGLSRILQKGSGIRLEGHIHTSSYDKNGEKRYSTEVIAHSINLLPSGKYRDTASSRSPSLPVEDNSLAPLARARAPEAPVALQDLPF